MHILMMVRFSTAMSLSVIMLVTYILCFQYSFCLVESLLILQILLPVFSLLSFSHSSLTNSSRRPIARRSFYTKPFDATQLRIYYCWHRHNKLSRRRMAKRAIRRVDVRRSHSGRCSIKRMKRISPIQTLHLMRCCNSRHQSVRNESPTIASS